MKKYLMFPFFVAISFYASSSQACFYTSATAAKITEQKKEVFLFHDGENAHMIIRTTLNAKNFPSEVAWLLPLPSLPSKYEEVDGPVFEELRQLSGYNKTIKGRGAIGAYGEGGDGVIKKKMEVHDPVNVGQFKIQPIEILQDGSDKELNDWLKKNKFAPLSFKSQKEYLKKGAAFLAIRMEMNHPNSSELVSRPLHIVYHSDKLSVPVKFNEHEKDLALEIYVFSKQELKKDLGSHLSHESSQSYENKHLSPMVDHIVQKDKGYITIYSADKLGEDLKNDPSFAKAEL